VCAESGPGIGGVGSRACCCVSSARCGNRYAALRQPPAGCAAAAQARGVTLVAGVRPREARRSRCCVRRQGGGAAKKRSACPTADASLPPAQAARGSCVCCLRARAALAGTRTRRWRPRARHDSTSRRSQRCSLRRPLARAAGSQPRGCVTRHCAHASAALRCAAAAVGPRWRDNTFRSAPGAFCRQRALRAAAPAPRDVCASSSVARRPKRVPAGPARCCGARAVGLTFLQKARSPFARRPGAVARDADGDACTVVLGGLPPACAVRACCTGVRRCTTWTRRGRAPVVGGCTPPVARCVRRLCSD
jgi:hypothetical protein